MGFWALSVVMDDRGGPRTPRGTPPGSPGGKKMTKVILDPSGPLIRRASVAERSEGRKNEVFEYKRSLSGCDEFFISAEPR